MDICGDKAPRSPDNLSFYNGIPRLDSRRRRRTDMLVKSNSQCFRLGDAPYWNGASQFLSVVRMYSTLRECLKLHAVWRFRRGIVFLIA